MVLLVPVRGRNTGGRQGNKRVVQRKQVWLFVSMPTITPRSTEIGSVVGKERTEEDTLALMAHSSRVIVAVLFGLSYSAKKAGQVLPCPVNHFCF